MFSFNFISILLTLSIFQIAKCQIIIDQSRTMCQDQVCYQVPGMVANFSDAIQFCRSKNMKLFALNLRNKKVRESLFLIIEYIIPTNGPRRFAQL